MTFNFHHLKVDYPNGEKWALADFDFIKLKEILSTWQTEMNKGGDGMHYFGATMISLALFHAMETTNSIIINLLKCSLQRFI